MRQAELSRNLEPVSYPLVRVRDQALGIHMFAFRCERTREQDVRESPPHCACPSKGTKVIWRDNSAFRACAPERAVLRRLLRSREGNSRPGNQRVDPAQREFDGVIHFDEAVRDPGRPSQLLPAFDRGDHLHVNDRGKVAKANAFD